MNSFQGKTFIFLITNEKASLITPILSVPSDGVYSLGILDNLLLIHNHSECISIVYDIKRYHLIFPIGPPSSLPLLKGKNESGENFHVIGKEIKKDIARSKVKTAYNAEHEVEFVSNISKTATHLPDAILESDLNQLKMNETEADSIVVHKVQKLSESVDPTYFQRMQELHDENSLNINLKKVFDKSPLRPKSEMPSSHGSKEDLNEITQKYKSDDELNELDKKKESEDVLTCEKNMGEYVEDNEERKENNFEANKLIFENSKKKFYTKSILIL